MSYQVLARKYRPANFDELVGQEHVLKALSSALDHQRMHHAYLFTGTRGVGKTTIARILARCLNCDEGVTSKPCGKCSACEEINEGRFVDLIEVDAASRTKVEDTRELLENVQYSPTRGRYKVYLIDEVHMLSNHSFNALLKTLEEPPPHVVFLLATTDPQKLPPTVLSRCLQFNLKNMTAERIVAHLQQVLNAENIPAEETALWQLARAANGSMRDALSLTDQAIAYADQNLSETSVAAMLGSMDQSQVHGLFAAIAKGDTVTALSIVDQMDQQSPDYRQALSQLLSLLHQLALHKSLPDYQPALSEAELESLQQLAETVSAEEIQLYYQLGLKSQSDLAYAPDPKSGFEMAILRMIAFRPVSPSNIPGDNAGDGKLKKNRESLSSSTTPSTKSPDDVKAGNIAQHEAAVSSLTVRDEIKHTTESLGPVENLQRNAGVSAGSSVAAVDEQAEAGEPHLPEDADVEPKSPSDSLLDMYHDVEPEDAHQEPDKNAVAPTVSRADVLDRLPEDGFDNEHWLAIFPELALTGLLANFANHCVLQRQQGNQWFFMLDKGHSALQDSGLDKQLSKALQDFLDRKVSIEIIVAELELDSPARRQRLLDEQQRLAALEVMKQQPTVDWLQQQFSAEIDEKTVSFTKSLDNSGIDLESSDKPLNKRSGS